MPMPIPPRTTTLDPDTPLTATLGIGHPWWVPLRPWRPGMRFEDVARALLDMERVVENVPLGPPPAPSGCYGCSARMVEESRFAEPEIAVAA